MTRGLIEENSRGYFMQRIARYFPGIGAFYGNRDGEEKIGAGDRWKDWVSIEGRDR